VSDHRVFGLPDLYGERFLSVADLRALVEIVHGARSKELLKA